MARISCKPNLFELSFGKEGKDHAALLILAIDDYLIGIDMENPPSGITRDNIIGFARILYELKTAPLSVSTPRCNVKLMDLFYLEKIVRDYGEKHKVYNCKRLAMYLHDIFNQMKTVQWGD